MRILYSVLIMPPGKYYGGERHHIILAKKINKILGADVQIVTYNIEEYSEIWKKLMNPSLIREKVEGLETLRLPVLNVLPIILNPISYLSHKILWHLLSNLENTESYKSLFSKEVLIKALLILSEYYRRRIGYVPGRKLLKEVKRFDPDVIHVYGIHWTNLAYRLAKIALRRRNTILAVWTIYHHILPRERIFMERPSIINILKEADVIISSTDVERRVICNLLRRAGGFKQEKAKVVPVPIEIENFINPSKDEVEKFRENLGNPDKIVLTMTLNKEKGAIDVLRALARIRTSEKIAFVSFGRARNDEVTLFKKISQNLPKNVSSYYFGYVDDITKSILFVLSDLFAMPSISDSFGIAYAEAWYYGKPVIAAKNPVMEEVIGNKRRGILVPYGNVQKLSEAITELLSDRQLAKKLAENGRRYLYNELESTKVARKVYQIYAEALEKK